MSELSVSDQVRYELSVQTSPGPGVLSRKPHALLFIPDPQADGDALLTAFSESSSGDELEALAETAMDNELDLPAFVAVHVGEQVTLRAFGNVELRTDLPSVPLLSAGASTTWVEHRIHGSPCSALVSTGEDPLDSRTDVVLGVVNAGGFGARLTQPTGEPPAGKQPIILPKGLPGDTPSLAETEAEMTDRSELLEYVLGAFPQPTETTQTMQPAEVAKTTAPVGELLFDDGQRHLLIGDVVLGRNPVEKAEATAAEPLIVTGDRVSRAHMKVCVTGDQVWVEDCESRNGSVLIGSPDDGPFKLIANSPQEIDDGAVMYLGSRSFTFSRGGVTGSSSSSTPANQKDAIYG